MLYTPEERNQIQRAYEMALRNSRAWDVLLPSEKLNLLQSIEDKIAMDHNRLTADVNFRQLPDHVWGQQLGNSIILNASKMGNFQDMVTTLYHENAHIEDAQLRDFPEKQLALTESQKAQLAARNTPVPDAYRDYKGYYHHPAEVNAREAEETGLAGSRPTCRPFRNTMPLIAAATRSFRSTMSWCWPRPQQALKPRKAPIPQMQRPTAPALSRRAPGPSRTTTSMI